MPSLLTVVGVNVGGAVVVNWLVVHYLTGKSMRARFIICGYIDTGIALFGGGLMIGWAPAIFMAIWIFVFMWILVNRVYPPGKSGHGET